MVAGLSWWLADGSEVDAKDVKDTEEGKHYYRVLRDMMDDNGNLVGFSEAIDLFADDILNAREGGCWEVIRDKGGVAQAVLHVDAATIRFTHDPKRPVFQVSPWGEVSELWEADRFGQARWHPLPQMGAALLNRTPIQLAYTAIAILTSSDTYNFKIIAEPIPAGLLNLGPGFNRDKAVQWKASWDAAMRGIQPEPVHVIYGTPGFQYQAFRPPPRDMAFDTSFHNYASLVAACFEMSILDISILTRVATKAAAEVQAEATERQGLRHLMKKISEAIEKYILPEGIFFHFEDISPKDEQAEADIAVKETGRIVQAVGGKLLTEEQGFEILQQMKHIPADMKYDAAEFEKRKQEAQEQFQQKQEAESGQQTTPKTKKEKAVGEKGKAAGPPAKKEVGKATVEKAEQSPEELLSRQLKEKPLEPPKADDPYWDIDDAYQEELAARAVEAEKSEQGMFGWSGAAECTICGRALTDPSSVAKGIGPVCEKHMGPGPHPSGSKQSAHVGGRAKGAKLPEGGRRGGFGDPDAISSVEIIGSGSSLPAIVEFADYSRGVHKFNENVGYGNPAGEVLIYEISEALGWGIVPETINWEREPTPEEVAEEWKRKGNIGVPPEIREGERKPGTLQEFVEDSFTWDDPEAGDKMADFLYLESPAVTLLDAMTGNHDRHEGNILENYSGDIWAIDNNGAFGFTWGGEQSYGSFQVDDLRGHLIERLADIQEYGEPEWFAWTVGQYDSLFADIAKFSWDEDMLNPIRDRIAKQVDADTEMQFESNVDSLAAFGKSPEWRAAVRGWEAWAEEEGVEWG